MTNSSINMIKCTMFHLHCWTMHAASFVLVAIQSVSLTADVFWVFCKITKQSSSIVQENLLRISLDYACSVSFLFFFLSHFYFPASSGQAVVTGVVPSPPRFLPSIFIAHRVSAIPLLVDCSSSVASSRSLALSASQFVHKKKSQRIYTRVCMHSAGLELTKRTHIGLEDNNLIRHLGDRRYK